MFFTDCFADVPDPLEAGAPSHDTFSRVFRLLDPVAFGIAFQRFMTTSSGVASSPPSNHPRAKNALSGLKCLGRVEAWRTVGAETTYRV